MIPYYCIDKIERFWKNITYLNWVEANSHMIIIGSTKGRYYIRKIRPLFNKVMFLHHLVEHVHPKYLKNTSN